ncbi:exosortase A, partial [Falsiroseomonas oryzae]|uniref:exosortase A n=1 Tax=Falsiroseomonas oryzae TaxID=2766473 RepID=UPI0022EABD92
MARPLPPGSLQGDDVALPGGDASAGWRPTLILLALGVAGLGYLFADEVAAAVRIWDSSAAYNHCWLVLPIAIWLAWQRRDRLRGMQPRPAPLFALLGIPAGLAWLLAERLGIMEGRQLTALGLFYVLMLSVLGWRICLAIASPLIYLVFLVPFGAFATPALQKITAWMIDVLLDATSIPHYVDDLIIETPAGVFLVAEACAGLRFLIAALAFGALYAMVMFRSPGRRALVMVLALVVPIVANGFRAFGIVLLGHYLGSAEAAAADHIIYGWVFFSFVMLLLIVIGLPFREDGAPDPRRAPPQAAMSPPRSAAVAAAAVAA